MDWDGDPAVRRRMTEFLGGESLRTASAVFVQGIPPAEDVPTEPLPPSELPRLLGAGCEVARSLWDRRSLVVDMDIEYVNFDFPGEVYLEPGRSFALQEPTIEALRGILSGVGIEALHLYTGRGHHFMWSVAQESRVFRRLASLGRVAPALAADYEAPHPPSGLRVGPALGRAFAGLGLVMEHVGHRVRDEAGPRSRVPVELGELRLGPVGRGLEIVAIDLSEYGDALHTRRVGLPFSRYLKPQRSAGLVGEHVERDLAPIWTIPDPGTSRGETLRLRCDAAAVYRLAQTTWTRIPHHASAMESLVSEYESSELARFHDYFYEEEQEPPERWPVTYDRVAPESLPDDAARALGQPNDLLLQPVGLLSLVRALLERSWHPRHIAGLVRSKYERDHGWGARWYADNATARAEYYARLFSGMIALGRDPPAGGTADAPA